MPLTPASGDGVTCCNSTFCIISVNSVFCNRFGLRLEVAKRNSFTAGKGKSEDAKNVVVLDVLSVSYREKKM